MNNIIEVFMMNEIKEVMRKFENINNVEKVKVEEFINSIDSNEIKDTLMKDYKECLKAIKLLENNEYREGVLDIYNHASKIIDRNISLEFIKECVDEVITYDAVRIDSEHIMYRKDAPINDFCKDIVNEMLESSSHWDRLFDKDMIIEYMMEATDKRDIVRELVHSSDIEDLLGIDDSVCFEIGEEEYVFSYIEV
ncbi:MAG: hypothetical protein ACRCWM_09325 [Sarcina sp.]